MPVTRPSSDERVVCEQGVPARPHFRAESNQGLPRLQASSTPMSHVFGRDTRASFPVAVRGEGLFIYDATGKRYLDASGGAAVSCLGHGHPVVREAIKRQVDRLEYAHTGYFM